MPQTLYEQVMDAEFSVLPPALQTLHGRGGVDVFCGHSSVEIGAHPLAPWICRLMRFPKASASVPVTVTMLRQPGREQWTRVFGKARFASVLSAGRGPGLAVERFGPLSFDVRLVAESGGLSMPLLAGRVLGIPLPRWLTPESRTREFVDDDGHPCFDVEILMPWIGRVIRYRGVLDGV